MAVRSIGSTDVDSETDIMTLVPANTVADIYIYIYIYMFVSPSKKKTKL